MMTFEKHSRRSTARERRHSILSRREKRKEIGWSASVAEQKTSIKESYGPNGMDGTRTATMLMTQTKTRRERNHATSVGL